MASGIFNIALGTVVAKFRSDPAKFGALLLSAAEADAGLVDYESLDTLLAAAGNTEATATNYARKTALTATAVGGDPDHNNDQMVLDLPDQTWTSLGGASNNTLVKIVVFYEESAADTGRVPIFHDDLNTTTDGSDFTYQFSANGFFRATSTSA